eukprot:CAMPEP_0180666910 /NCGR_PEP_ID=MMETSP1037_2-20121125/62062_1 /TAXON_ID=632150 /ORGANISM="Azadinium spinosum, Strain 3D9" /LENGTH=34 /DNA_ID= /DNA_START= /DNA_END= /DNA_ORIENTATION=
MEAKATSTSKQCGRSAVQTLCVRRSRKSSKELRR